jgi:(R,R)-butanediol dehydrogenase / meso-butanediol dehydrogenase / diacetyl reductase
MNTAFRAAHFVGNRKFVLAEGIPATPPGPGRVAIDVAFTGLCGTDLHVYHGQMAHRVKHPLVVGHEMSGNIAAVGPDVAGLSLGDPVTVMPLALCGDCRPCRSGNTQICYRLGFLGIDAAGSMQERWEVPASIVFPLPRYLPLDEAALVEPVAVAVHDIRRAQVVAGEKAVVIGGGPVGQLIALVARAAGADVLLSEPDEGRRRFAADLGTRSIDPTADDLIASVNEWTDGEGADLTFEVSASPAGTRAMTDVLAGRGRAVVVGIQAQPAPVDLFRVFWRELTLVGARTYQPTDFDEAIRLAASGELPLRRFISEVHPLAAAQQAFERLEGGAGLMKVLIDCRA